jgi:hypothetical protein
MIPTAAGIMHYSDANNDTITEIIFPEMLPEECRFIVSSVWERHIELNERQSSFLSCLRHDHVHLDKPKARIESQNRYPLTINSTATFRCIVSGNPEPQFR